MLVTLRGHRVNDSVTTTNNVENSLASKEGC